MAKEKRPGAGSAKKGRPDSGDSLRDFVVDRVTEKINEKVERPTANAARQVEHLERHAARAAKTAESLERVAAQIGALDVWTRIEPAARRPRFTRDEIAAAAMHIADAEGFDAVSMRRIAVELDAGTMTLYHYVRTKDELLTLVTDAVMGEVVVPPDEPLPDNWRAALTVLAHRSLAAMRRHPWILDITDDPSIGPNSVRHFDQTLAAVASLPISLIEKLDVAGMVDEYVFGYCLQVRNNAKPVVDDDSGMVTYVESLLDTGDYPQIAAIAGDIGLETAWSQIEAHMRDEKRFDRNLSRLLDGIEASLPRS